MTACAGSGVDYDTVFDGPKNAAYRADLGACQQSAEESLYADYDPEANDDAISGAAMGAAIGGAIGPGIGAAIGASMDAGDDAYDAENRYYQDVIDCMTQRGYRIAGAQ